MAKVSFENGKIWEVDLSNELKNKSMKELINDIQEKYNLSIKRLDFQINVEKVKHDIAEETHRFLQQS